MSDRHGEFAETRDGIVCWVPVGGRFHNAVVAEAVVCHSKTDQQSQTFTL